MKNYVKNRYNVDHYQKLISYNGTKVVDNFDLLDKQIIKYLNNPKLDQEGRDLIKINFAGVSKKSSSDRILERILFV